MSQSRPSARTRFVALAATSLLAVLAAASFAAPAAQAAPGSPGTPSAPVPLWHEDFENFSAGEPGLLTDYQGANGITYTADPAWTNPAECTGILSKFAVAVYPSCVRTRAQAWGRQFAYALGAFNGDPAPATNVALTEMPTAATGANTIEFATVAPLHIPVTDRFIGFSLDAAWYYCSTAQKLSFSLKDGATEIPASTSPISPCYEPGRTTKSYPGLSAPLAGYVANSAYTSRLAANSAVLFSGSEFGIVLRNSTNVTNGNEYSLDNIRAFDSTPQLDKSFSLPGPLKTGTPVKLRFTVTNTTELARKAGWSFTDELPDGLIVASTPNLTSTCGPVGSIVSADAGSSTIRVTDGVLAAAATSCVISVDVTANDPGTYANEKADFTTSGLNEPNGSAVVYALVAGAPMGNAAAIGGGITLLLLVTAIVFYRRRRSAASAA